MTEIKSRKNPVIGHIRKLNEKRSYRYECGEFVCDGRKLYREALSAGAKITSVLLEENSTDVEIPAGAKAYVVDAEMLRYASRLETPTDMLFTCAMPADTMPRELSGSVLVLDGVQDPGNVGTILRTAEAFSVDCVALLEGCADPYNPKTVRSTMGAVFRQKFFSTDLETLKAALERSAMPLYASALSERAVSVLDADLKNAAVAVGSEGQGLSRRLLDMCRGEIIIPMNPESESLNAAVAASVLMWEMYR